MGMRLVFIQTTRDNRTQFLVTPPDEAADNDLALSKQFDEALSLAARSLQ